MTKMPRWRTKTISPPGGCTPKTDNTWTMRLKMNPIAASTTNGRSGSQFSHGGGSVLWGWRARCRLAATIARTMSTTRMKKKRGTVGERARLPVACDGHMLGVLPEELLRRVVARDHGQIANFRGAGHLEEKSIRIDFISDLAGANCLT